MKEYEQKHAFLTDCSTLLKQKKYLVSWLNAQAEIIESNIEMENVYK